MNQKKFGSKNCICSQLGWLAIVTLIYVSGSAATSWAKPSLPVYRIKPSVPVTVPVLPLPINVTEPVSSSLPVCASKKSIDWVAETNFYTGWLQSSNVLVRREAAIALGCIAEKNPDVVKLAVPTLTRALQDSEEIVRFRSAIILGDLGEKPTETLPRLIEVLYYSQNQSLVKSTSRALNKLSQRIEQQATQFFYPN